MAKNLDLNILGEGIETKKQLDLLNEKSCGIGQGFYFSKAIVPDAIENLLQQNKLDT